MRTPIQSEADAFRLAYGTAVVCGVCVIVGAAVDPIAGAALFTAIALALFVWDLMTEDKEPRRPLREAADASPAPATDGTWRILVVANETVVGDELKKAIMQRAKLNPELMVVAPVLASRVHTLTTDIDRELREAQGRLDKTLAWASAQGLKARGEVGNTSPQAAMEDALRRFGADEVIISTHPPGKSNWLESGLVERAREELEVTVTHVVVDLARDAVEIVA
jgi:GABA permease